MARRFNMLNIFNNTYIYKDMLRNNCCTQLDTKKKIYKDDKISISITRTKSFQEYEFHKRHRHSGVFHRNEEKTKQTNFRKFI